MAPNMQGPYYVRGSALGSSHCRIDLIRSNSQFYLNIPLSDVQNTPLGVEFFRLAEEFDALERHDMEAYHKPIDLICSHFLPLFEQLAPPISINSLTLEDYAHAPTYRLNVFGTESGDLDVRGAETRLSTPACFIAPLAMSSAPGFWKTIPQTQARDLTLVFPAAESNLPMTAGGDAKTADGSIKYFKPREEAREKEFTREVQILQQIKEKGLAGSQCRLPVLDSLVMADTGEEVIIGILMNTITPPDLGCQLQSPGFRNRVDLHKKWEEQVRSSLRILHENDIVWGDVNPCNVVVDEKFDAWIIDFGGLNNAEFVDDDKAETKAGDLQGVERLFGTWLPSRVC